jgi:uncharacterized membrane protein YeaQ/YmgE (transglycosylase-associated protein family)
MLHIVWSVVVGFIIGYVARALYPGAQHMHFLMTALLGIAGSFVGGLIGRLVSKPAPGAPFHPAGILLSIVGALVILWVWIHFNLPQFIR